MTHQNTELMRKIDSQRSYIYVLTRNSKSPILNFSLKHKYTITMFLKLKLFYFVDTVINLMPSFIMRSNESPNRFYVYDIALKQMFELLLTGSNPGVLISSDKSMSMSEDNDLMYFELHNSDNTCIPFCFVNAISSTQEFNTIYANNVDTLKYILTNNDYRGRIVNPSVEWSNNVHQVYQSKYKNITNYAIIKDTDPWYTDTVYLRYTGSVYLLN